MREELDCVWFGSAIDRWLVVVLALAPLSTLAICFQSLGGDPLGLWIGLGLTALVLGLYGVAVLPVRYGIGAEQLHVRSGLLRWELELRRITRVAPTRCILSSPALSLRRLEVVAGHRLRDRILISPREREAFLELLAERAGLVREGDRLVRPASS